jgi:hypothetical protein
MKCQVFTCPNCGQARNCKLALEAVFTLSGRGHDPDLLRLDPGRPAARSRLSGPRTWLCISPGRPDKSS